MCEASFVDRTRQIVRDHCIKMWQKWFTCVVPLMMLGVASAKPNIVIFVVDDLGFSDLGCFGNDTIKTPNIDRLAEQGARLRHDVTPDAICTPNRAALLTGRYPIRSGLASDEGQDRVFLHTAASGGLPQNETTFAEIASAAGYKTGCVNVKIFVWLVFLTTLAWVKHRSKADKPKTSRKTSDCSQGIVGKWHLGLHKSSKTDFHFHPLKQGFDFYYGLPLTNLRTCEPGQYLINIVHPALKPFNVLASGLVVGVTLYILYLAGVLNKMAFLSLLTLVFLITSAQAGWLLLLSRLTCIVLKNYELVEQPVLLENLTARFTDEAVGFIHKSKDSPFLLYMSFAKVHTALFTTKPFVNHSVHGRYGDNVEEMDWGVGQVMAAVEELGLRKNTFAYFTSDNGPYIEEISDSGEYHGGWSGIYKGGKGQCWDGGVRMPTIVSWPGHIPAGISIDQLTSSMDLLPTVAKLTGGDLPQDRVIDGRDLLPLLTNQTQASSHDFVFHYCGNVVHAVRYHPKNSVTVWKAHFVTAKWSEGTESCRGRGICWCHGDFVNVHDPPLLFDVTNDPAESSPIAPNSPEYKEAIKYIHPALARHNDTIESVPEQLVWSKNRVHPSLQMCCNFPYCTCKETDKKLKHYPHDV